MSARLEWTPQESMVSRVARALGTEIAEQVVFVGGCATALLVTDEFTRNAVRFTDDVDVIVHVIGNAQWHRLEEQLAARGFFVSPLDEVLCRRRLRDDQPNELIVDFMPDYEAILGFSNRWYTEALANSIAHALPDGVTIRLVSPEYFLATKLVAYEGRGNNDPLASRDIEDILNVIDGRDTLATEVRGASAAVQSFIAERLLSIRQHRDFDYAVQACARNDQAREAIIFLRLESLSAAP